MKHRIILPSLLAFLVALVLAGPVSGQSVEEEVKQAAERLEAARAEQVDLVSPRHFAEAEKKLREAQERYKRGGKIDEIRKYLSESRRDLTKAREFVEVGKVLLRDAIKARADAAEANAPEFAATDWGRAETEMTEAGKRVERGDQNGTRDRASRAEALYRASELKAIRADVLGKTRQARADAVSAEAPKWSSATFADAEGLLNKADSELSADRYDRSEARAVAEMATSQYARAARIARTARSVDDNVRTRLESVVLEHEALFAKVAEALRRTPDFAAGAGPVTDEILSSIASLYDDRANLEEELGRKNAEIERLINVEIRRLNNLTDSLDTRLALLEQRERAVQAELQVREEREARINRVKSTFEAGEGEVSISGDQMIVRLYGLKFPSGSAEIRPENFGLLTKVQRVLREFSTSPVLVAGHTDSRGNDATNLALSKRRADAVREYLLANMTMDDTRITAVGYGEAQPIASNETEDGRALNRRIDVVLSLSGEPLSGL